MQSASEVSPMQVAVFCAVEKKIYGTMSPWRKGAPQRSTCCERDGYDVVDDDRARVVLNAVRPCRATWW